MAEKRPNINIDRPGHILVLDERWHQLFARKKPFRISQLQNKLNKLLKEQGKVNTEYNGYKNLKKQMMEEIVEFMEDDSSDAISKKQRNRRYIGDINRKFDRYETRKVELPVEIEAVNKELLNESMIYLYKRLIEAKEESAQLEKTITEMKSILKEKVGDREDREQEISRLYTFMHDIAGFEAIETLDRYYLGDKK